MVIKCRPIWPIPCGTLETWRNACISWGRPLSSDKYCHLHWAIHGGAHKHVKHAYLQSWSRDDILSDFAGHEKHQHEIAFSGACATVSEKYYGCSSSPTEAQAVPHVVRNWRARPRGLWAAAFVFRKREQIGKPLLCSSQGLASVVARTKNFCETRCHRRVAASECESKSIDCFREAHSGRLNHFKSTWKDRHFKDIQRVAQGDTNWKTVVLHTESFKFDPSFEMISHSCFRYPPYMPVVSKNWKRYAREPELLLTSCRESAFARAELSVFQGRNVCLLGKSSVKRVDRPGLMW